MVTAIGVGCEDNLDRPAVDDYLSLVATPAVQGTDALKGQALWKGDPIEIERRVVLLVDSQNFGTSDDYAIMGAQEIPDRDRNIKFHLDPVTLRPDSAEAKIPIFY
jgi:hypothetical protein